MVEIWKDIAGYEGKYQVSNLGNVKSLRYRGSNFSKNLTPKTNNDGRLWVELAGGSKPKQFLVHRLVAMAFIPNPNGYAEINHKDENPQNNVVNNLEWCTRQYNVSYYYDRHPHPARPHVGRKHGCLTMLQVDQFSKDGAFVKRWDNSREIYVQTGMSDWSISQCCRGKRKSAYGYIWRYVS